MEVEEAGGLDFDTKAFGNYKTSFRVFLIQYLIDFNNLL